MGSGSFKWVDGFLLWAGRMFRKCLFIFFLLTLIPNMAMANGKHPKALEQEVEPESFKILKERSMDPKTGFPKTLDPTLFSGKAKQAYQIAKEIPEVLAQIHCFCECEAFGHENLLDCFIDQHGAG